MNSMRTNGPKANYEALCMKVILERGCTDEATGYDDAPLKDFVQVRNNTLFAVCGGCAVSVFAAAGSEELVFSSPPCVFK